MTINRSVRAALAAVFFCLGAAALHAQQTQTWLMLNPISQETFFVTDPAEQTGLTKAGWKVNGTGLLQAKAQPNTAALQRLVKNGSQGIDRVFAVTSEESAAATKAGYRSEGVLGQISPTQLTPDLIPVYHFTKGPRNLWLIDKSEPWVAKSGWIPKGVAFWLWPKTSP